MQLAGLKKILFFFLLTYLPAIAYSQNIPLGTWRTHLSYQSVQTVAFAEGKIYAASASGLFYFDLANSVTTTISKIDGLSDIQIGKLAYNNALKSLLIAYANGNIDIIQDNKIYNINAIEKANINKSKKINHVFFYNDFAYLSCDFGMVVVDLKKKEIKETYQNIGFNGTSIEIYASAIQNNQIFLASAQGVMSASLNANLLDFNSWTTFNNNIPQKKATSLTAFNSKIYAYLPTDGLFKFQNNNWSQISNITPIYNLQSLNNKIIISSSQKIYFLDDNDNFTEFSDPTIQNPQEIIYDNKNTLWIADATSGLLSNWEGIFKNYSPNSPFSKDTWSLYYFNNKIVATSGGHDENYNPINNDKGYYIFENGFWQNYNALYLNSINTPLVRDLVDATFNIAENKLYLASFSEGILTQQDQVFEKIDKNNAPLTNNQISSIFTDISENIWITNFGVAANQSSVFLKSHTNNNWQSFTLNNKAGQFPMQILIDDNNFKWIRSKPTPDAGGIWVMDELGNQKKYLSTVFGQGALVSNNVYCMAKDKQGAIWVGTDKGVMAFYNPSEAFINNSFEAEFPIYDNKPLLKDEAITAIAIDGGNRKWIGTKKGLWLFDQEGKELLFNFTKENSPLLANEILDIAIHSNTGEVFIATSEGIISYRSDATEGQEIFQNVKIFPNPVYPTFTGLLGISGLANNAIVKITDISGKLIYQTRANGGTASWDVKDYNGRKALAGIYLVFMTVDGGTQTFVSKIAILN